MQDGAPHFLIFTLECAAEGDRNWRPSENPLPEAVVRALDRSRGRLAAPMPTSHRRATSTHEVPDDDACERYREDVMAGDRRALGAQSRREQGVQVSAYDAMRPRSAGGPRRSRVKPVPGRSSADRTMARGASGPRRARPPSPRTGPTGPCRSRGDANRRPGRHPTSMGRTAR